MLDEFKIYIDRLRDGHTEEVEESVSPDFLEVKEEGLSFHDPVLVQGEAYIANSDLILHFNVSTHAIIPCSICNEPVKIPVENVKFYHVEPLQEIKSGIFNFKNILREAILLEVPGFAECHQGECPQRKVLKQYLNKQHKGEETYRPFADLE